MRILNVTDPTQVLGEIEPSGDFHFSGDVTFEQFAAMFPTAKVEVAEYRVDDRGQRFIVAGRILSFSTGGKAPHAPEVMLASGAVVAHRTLGQGVQQAFVIRGRDGAMTPREMDEYNRIMAKRAQAH